MLEKIKDLTKSLGPGFIIASVVLGPGSIAVASRIGSEEGYSFLWVIILAAICMIVYTSMAVRFGVTKKESMLETIAEKYGRWFAVLIGISSFMSASSFQFGNNLGIGIGMEGITGIDERVWPFFFTSLAIMLLFWATNLYKVLEKLMMVLVMIMILAFFVNLLLTAPDLTQLAKGFLPLSLKLDDMDIVAALVATTFAVNGAIYQSYLVQNKGWKESNLKRGLNDSYMGIFFLALISILIIITSAAALKPQGITVNSAADMALQLEALFGSYAKIIFSLGLCAAAFSSLMVNAVIGGGLLSDGLGLGGSMNEKMPKVFTAVVLLLGMLVAVFFRGDVIYALIIAQASTIMSVPLIAIGMYLILNNKQVMGKFRNNPRHNILAILGFLLISFIVYFLYSRLLTFLSTV
ncbi:Nramp family divalent metal transporter [Autumnicola edwardsiae]|uniref:Nramp family divalent metal transporter n=1 Tax=Autumnicola edwardsiae TaxID=3075594 RepID=A0ABU3CWP9_9FLAO|nr:Nramp family divalent metal transporter [Zunongwangia sp. F297]MDT0650637.1 Nramp family divalent metal transporter [Zunongwangia sp. F297]